MSADQEVTREETLCRQMGIVQECGARRPCREHDGPPALEVAVADAILDHVDTAIRASHRPDNVEHLFIDANARHVFAAAVLAMPEMQTLRRVLRRAWGTDIENNSASLTRNLRQAGLHESFVQWVVQQ